MKLTEHEFNTLAPYEQQMSIALNSHYARGISRTVGDAIHAILVRVTGVQTRFNASCSHCVYNLLCDIGRIYFADKAEKEAAQAASRVRTEEMTVEPVKVEIKTDSAPKKAKKPAVKKTTTKKTATTKAKK